MSQFSPIATDLERQRLSSVKELSIRGNASLQSLLEMLTDPSWVVRRAVVVALAQLGNVAVEPLCELLRTKRDSEARIAAAVDALSASLGSTESALERLSMHSEPAIVADALQVMGRRRKDVAVPLLIKFTRHPDDVVAVSAVEALGRIGGRAAVEALIETIGGGNFFRTFPAIDILGRSGDRRVIEPLAALLRNPNYLPESARALGRTGERAAIKPLVELLKSNLDSVVRVAALALWDLHERFSEKTGENSKVIDEQLQSEVSSEMVQRLSRVMSSMDINETVAICRLLGCTRNAEAAPLLSGKLDGPDSVAAAAAEALTKISKESDTFILEAIRLGDSSRRKILLPILTRSAAAPAVALCLNDVDAEVRAVASETLGRLGNAQVVSQLFPLLADLNARVSHAATAAIQALGTRDARRLAADSALSSNPVVRRAALRILAYFGDTSSLQPILNALEDSDSRVREVALQGLPYLEDPRAHAALFNAVRSEDPKTRAAAVRSLGQLPKADERAYAILLRCISDVDAWVRYYACQSLGRLGYAPSAEEISKLICDEAGQVRVAAVEALSHFDSPRSHQALIEAAVSEEPDVKRAALIGLGMTHRTEDLPTVLGAASSSDIPTRLIALSALVGFHSPLVLAALAAAATDSDEQIRSASIGFLASKGEEEATDVLINLLESQQTFTLAREALLVPNMGRISGLLVALEAASEESAPVLVSILANIPRGEAKTALLAAMKLNNAAARKAAATAIAANRNPAREQVLRDAAANDPDQGVRQICALLLAE